MKWLRFAMLAAGMVLMTGSAAFLVKNHVRAAEARAWPRARARIVESRVETVHARQVGDAGEFLPYVRYDYAVQGRSFHGSMIWLDERRSFDSAAVAARELAFLEAGSEVEVLYDPRDPAEAALIVEERIWPKILLFLLGALLAAFGWPRRKPAPGTQLATA